MRGRGKYKLMRNRMICPDAEGCPAKECRHRNVHRQGPWCEYDTHMCNPCISVAEFKEREKRESNK